MNNTEKKELAKEIRELIEISGKYECEVSLAEDIWDQLCEYERESHDDDNANHYPDDSYMPYSYMTFHNIFFEELTKINKVSANEMQDKVEHLKWKIQILQSKLDEYDEFIDNMFGTFKKHKKLKFRNVSRG